MDIIRFTNPNGPIHMQEAYIVNGLLSKMWVERYREAGEFELTGTIDGDIRKQLPIGSFISHVESDQIMIVENHEFTDDGESDPIVKVTGRSFETFLERRVIGSQNIFPTDHPVANFVLTPASTFAQAEDLIWYSAGWINTDLHIYSILSRNPPETDGYLPRVRRVIKKGPCYPELMTLLAINNLGVRAVRPNRLPPGLSIFDTAVSLIIYDGRDLTNSVLFAQSSGEIEQADYLWSNKKHMNCAYISGKWVDEFVGIGPAVNYLDLQSADFDVRMMHIDATDIDQAQPHYPTGDALEWIRAAMRIRGKAALASQKDVALVKVELTKDQTRIEYRHEYYLGDIVSVSGSYGTNDEPSRMRVSEYVEIEDEDGMRGYPTLEFENVGEDTDDDTIVIVPPPPEDTTPPGEVTDIEGTQFSTSIELSWINPIDSDFVGVVIRRTLGYDPATSHTDGTAVADLTGGETTYTDTGLTPSTRYCYVMFSYDSNGNFAEGLSSISIMTTA